LVKSTGQLRHFLLAFGLAAAVYGLAFYAMEHRRARNGPWRVTFSSAGGTNAPCLVINEPGLNLSDRRLTFPNHSAPATNTTVVFDQPRDVPFDLPFGKCIFLDGTALPGTVTLVLFGHEVELLPRAVTIDKKDYDWSAISNLEVRP
jgi:hypothetical protein